MIPILSITAFIILLYLAYPLWLAFFVPEQAAGEKETEEITCVSVILLSCNGTNHLQEKINFLTRELSSFECHELIIVDDNSSDGSVELLNDLSGTPHIKVLYNHKHEGIPFSMNLGIRSAKYEYVVFCDQRQTLSDHILQRIVEPLKYKNVGAVSGCISPIDHENRCSLLRRHENFVKSAESRTGRLIGVYGPFYALKKQSYAGIPDHIILDDLYLSLRILKTKQIVLREDCLITDKSMTALYDYPRTKRYLAGFIQILKEKSMISDLDTNQKIMLVWHKYLRLLIPVFIFFSYISIGYRAVQGMEYMLLFCLLSAAGLISLVPLKLKVRPKNLVRLNIYYFIGMIDITFNKVFFHR